MTLKQMQKKLKDLRDRIKTEGGISPESELVLRELLNAAPAAATDEFGDIKKRLTATMAMRAGNDNTLSDDQKARLRLIEKTGTGSHQVH